MSKRILIAALLATVVCMVSAVPAWAAESSPQGSSADTASAQSLSVNADLSAQATADGGWTINTKAGAYVTKAQNKLFAQATKGLAGVSYTPIFVMSKQVVAGTNYAYFCKAQTITAKPKTSWKIAIVYKPLSGKAKLIAVNNFNFKNISTRANAPKATDATGAWENLSKKYTSKVLPKKARTAFNKAKKAYVGVDLTPLVLLSTQTVAGTNYRYLCSGFVPGSSTTNYYAVDVYQNLKGKAKIKSCKVINMKKYLKTS